MVILMIAVALIMAAGLRSRVAEAPAFQPVETTPVQTVSGADPEEEIFPSSQDLSDQTVVTEDVLSDDRPPVALLVDDFGYNAKLAGRIANLDLPLTWAILPYLDLSGEMARLAGEKGVPFLLHLPMQAEIDGEDGPFLVGTAMEGSRIQEAVQGAIASLPGLSGVNNHRGSKATSDAGTMEAVLDVVGREGLIFVDSRTSSGSVAYDLAVKRGIPAAYNCIFLDHEADVQSMKKKLAMMVSRAHREGWAMAICHVRPRTVEFLEELVGDRPENIRFVTVPELISILGSR